MNIGTSIIFDTLIQIPSIPFAGPVVLGLIGSTCTVRLGGGVELDAFSRAPHGEINFVFSIQLRYIHVD